MSSDLKIEIKEKPAYRMPLNNESLELITWYCRSEDNRFTVPLVFDEALRVLKPDGILVVIDDCGKYVFMKSTWGDLIEIS